MNSMNTNTSHPLISNSQEYNVYKKYLSIHSENVNISKYTTNCFEIELPHDYLNVLSIKLTDINIPPTIYNSSQSLGNTTLYFDISLNPTDPTSQNDLQNVSLSVIIPDGTYFTQTDAQNIFNTIKDYMNIAVSNYLGVLPDDITRGYKCFVSNYNPNYIAQRQFGIYPGTTFTLLNKNPSTNFPISSNCTNVLGCNNGYYPSTTGSFYNALGFTGEFTSSVFGKIPGIPFETVTPVNTINFNTYDTIYMDIEGLNNLDEIQPYIQNQYTQVNSGNSGIVNSSFAKI